MSKRLADALFELALADQGALAAGAGLDQPKRHLRRLLAHQGLQADRVAQSGEAALAQHDDVARRGEHDALHRGGAARQIDHDPGEFAAQFVEQHVDRAGIDHQMLRRRRLGRQDAQIVGDLDHRPVDEQAVDARGLLQRFVQPAAGLGIELERDGAEMQIEIEKRGRSARSSASSQAQPTAVVVVPTPPRLPTKTITCPSPPSPAAARPSGCFCRIAASASRVGGLIR